MTERCEVIILGCVAQKRQRRAPAAELYDSQLWRARKRYAEEDGRPWLILSAQHGLVRPTDWLAPYEWTMRDWKRYPRELRELVRRNERELAAFGFRTVELHAGKPYVQLLGVGPVLIDCPLAGLGIGEQLGWYRERRQAVAS
jgi:hypothetical protein